MLEIADLSVAYGKHEALHQVTLRVDAGEIVAILGANGAGKTTLLGAVAGIVRARSGTVRLHGKELRNLSPAGIVEAGIALMPEGRRLFGPLTVAENLAMGAYPRRAHARAHANLARVLDLFPRLAERLKQPVRTMSGGEQQMVALARALMSEPEILLADEPSLGLAPIVARELFAAFARLKGEGRMAILLVEQNVRLGLGLADRGYLLALGRIAGSGSTMELARDPAVAKTYFGATDIDGTTLDPARFGSSSSRPAT